MIVIVVGNKTKHWEYLKNQYKGLYVIEVGVPDHIPLIEGYTTEFYRQQMINFVKRPCIPLLFVTYNTVCKYINHDNNIYVCEELKDVFDFSVIKSFEVISNKIIKINGEYKNLFTKEYIHLIKKIIPNLQFCQDFNLETVSTDILYFIPSIIHTSKSLFDWEDRLLQTEEQLKGLQDYGNSIVLEMSDIKEYTISQLVKLSKYATTVVLFGHKEEFVKISNDANKNKGEIYTMKCVLPKLTNNKFSHFYKFGGRYSLNKNYKDLYDPNYQLIGRFISKKDTNYDMDVIEPVIYCISRDKLECYISILNTMSIKLENEFLDVERMIPIYTNMTFKTKKIDRLNVNGYGAITGNFKYL